VPSMFFCFLTVMRDLSNVKMQAIAYFGIFGSDAFAKQLCTEFRVRRSILYFDKNKDIIITAD
jgi:hypothetical protein